MREVFLSHASHDHAKARQLREVLVAHDVPVWFSPHHIRGAQEWQDEIGEALAMWVKRELKYALSEKRYEKRILPLLFKPCDFRALSWTLPQFQFIDFATDYWRACDELLRVWKKRLSVSAQRKLGR